MGLLPPIRRVMPATKPRLPGRYCHTGRKVQADLLSEWMELHGRWVGAAVELLLASPLSTIIMNSGGVCYLNPPFCPN